jgi:hypothetical protein
MGHNARENPMIPALFQDFLNVVVARPRTVAKQQVGAPAAQFRSPSGALAGW